MLTIKHKFLLAGSLTFVSMLSVLLLSHYSQSKIQKFSAVSLSISNVETSMLTLRRNEKDFLARNDLAYKDDYESNFNSLIKSVTLLEESEINAGLNTATAGKMKEKFTAYKQSFLTLVSTQQEIGLHSQDGLYGSLREAVHQIEGELEPLNDQNLRASMLQLRRDEKDFMLRSDIKYLTSLVANSNIFLAQLITSPHPSETKDKIQSLMNLYVSRFSDLVTKSEVKGLTNAQGLLGEMRTKVHDSETMLEELSEQLNQTVTEEIGNIDQFELMINIAGLILSAFTILVLGWLAVGILKPIQELAQTMKKASNDNDLSLRVSVKSQDEIGQTSSAFNTMLESFQSIIAQVTSTATSITSASSELSIITTQSSQGAQAQQLETEQLATAMNEISMTVADVAKNAAEASTAASLANTESHSGHKIVNTAVETINTLSENIQNASTAISQVEEDSERVGTILDVIRGIADQTNLLALNAAIEAARAGEYGRGFAVVADEVRTLAGSTQKSTDEIQKMIESLQSGSKDAVVLMEASREQSRDCVEQTSMAGNALMSIVNAVTDIHDKNTQIASAAEEQAAVVNEIDRNITAISDVAGQSSVMANQTAEASTDLAGLATELKTLAAQFQT